MYCIWALLICALFLLDQASTAPTKLQPRRFKVERIRHGPATRNPQRALSKSYAKWGMTLPTVQSASSTKVEDVASNAASGETGEVSSVPTQDDAEYLSPISIGGQTLMMDFDTGSSDLWVFNTNLPSSESSGHTVYDPTKSSTFQLLKGQTYSISYGDGSKTAGVVGTDTVNIGGASVTSQAVELPTTVSGSFVTDASSNGLVGLAMSNLNTVQPTQQKTFFDNISGSLAQPVFTANLKHGTTGFYEFGTIDATMFAGNLAYTPIDDGGFWQFPSNSFSVGNGPVQQNTQGNPAIADTGTSLLLVDDSVMEGYYSQVTGAHHDDAQQGVIFPCDAALPDLNIAMGANYMGTLPGSGMIFAQVGGNTCYGAMQSNAGQNIQIFGDVMFKAQFVVFNIGDKSIGFAPHAD
ncbi:hypothetical protein MMC13_006397 [Lambiella insularis]|nr:hypothetical protein [Lambiella insularis]